MFLLLKRDRCNGHVGGFLEVFQASVVGPPGVAELPDLCSIDGVWISQKDLTMEKGY